MAVTDVEARRSQPTALDTNMSEIKFEEVGAKAESEQLEVPVSPIDSGSEYSQVDSRPVSMIKENERSSQSSDGEEDDVFESPVASRPVSMQADGIELKDEEAEQKAMGGKEVVRRVMEQEEEIPDAEPPTQYATLRLPADHLAPPLSPAFSTYSGSDYSQSDSRPTSWDQPVFTPMELPAQQDVRKSRPASIMVDKSVAVNEFVEEPLHTPSAETRSQPPISPDSKRSSQADELARPDDEAAPETKTHSKPASPKSKHDSQTTLSFDPMQSPSPYDDVSPWETQKAQVSHSSAAELDYFNTAPRSPQTPKMPFSPVTPNDARMSTNSMQSVALSESSLDYDHLSAEQVNDALATPRASGHQRKPSSLEILQNGWGDRPHPLQRQSTFFDITKDDPLETPLDGPSDDAFGAAFSTAEARKFARYSSAPSVKVVDTNSQRDSLATATRRSSSSGEGEEEVEVDWYALDKTEEQEKEDRALPEGTEDESTAFLLARLEQENAKFSADPKSSIVGNKTVNRIRSKSRPHSMAMLKKLVRQNTTPSIRYSLASEPDFQVPEEPPPMTELEFWGALVQDYTTTASRLPTLTTTKIRNGVPDPLRQIVWPSMAGARDKSLEEAFENLVGEPSPYEGIINKDVGRSFPGVELFRDAEGEGQKMLGRVLKCFSLFDKDIGYCQGLGFLVGPLLMNMGEKDAFCVLVRLMDHYALRPSFLPSLSGLHMRIFQFSTLLNQHHPKLSEHLTELGVEPAYLSQWFLSCFAVTCPLPMLFRIYDVIFAEGANETVMRVALALFRRNEERMLHSQEFEEVMQLLLGRHLWDVYGHNADELVDDFTSLGNIITHQRLAELEKEFESKDSDAVGQSAGFLPDVQAAASRFLGRLWAPSHNHTPSKSAGATLSPSSAEKDVVPAAVTTASPSANGGVFGRSGFLRRSPSKHSISTLNESSNSSEGSISTLASTAPTDAEAHDGSIRESHSTKPESMRVVSVQAGSMHEAKTPAVREQQELHTQIEDLLMALSEMQREHAQMAAMLQREREERGDDQRVVRQLVQRLKPQGKKDEGVKKERRSMPPPSRVAPSIAAEGFGGETKVEDKRRTLPARPRAEPNGGVSLKVEEPTEEKTPTPEDESVALLVGQVETRLDTSTRFSASLETKAQLRTTLARTREQLAAAEQQAKDRLDRAELAESSMITFQAESENLRAEAEELRVRVNDEFREKSKLELQVQNLEIQMRMEAKSLESKKKQERVMKLQRAESSGEVPTINTLNDGGPSRRQSIASAPGGGLRELRLGSGARDSVGSVQSIRSMRGQRPASPTVTETPVQVETSPIEAPVPASPATALAPSLAASPTMASAPAPPPAPPSAPVPPPVLQFAPLPPPKPKNAQHDRKPSSSLNVPGTFTPGHLPRKSSLATREVLATPKHEPVPDEALLLELVNAKTAEAQARQELDELKRSIQIQRRRMEEEKARMDSEKRRVDEQMFELQAEALNARADAEASRQKAEAARELARMARREVFDASPISGSAYEGVTSTPSISLPGTPGEESRQLGMSTSSSRSSTPNEKVGGEKKQESGSSAGGRGGGWFWSRRTASTNRAGM